MDQHVREAIHSQSHLYFIAEPFELKNELPKQNNPFNNWRTDPYFHRVLQFIFEICYNVPAKNRKCMAFSSLILKFNMFVKTIM